MEAERINALSPDAFDKALIIKKRSNIVICILIILFGVSSSYYTVQYEGGILLSYRDIAFSGTAFSVMAAFLLIIVNIWESAARKEIISDALYYVRLSSAVMEAVIFLIGAVEKIFGDNLLGGPSVLYRFDEAMMDVVIPLLVILSFCVNETPILVDQGWKKLYGAFLITLYSAVMTALILSGVIPENKIPFYCLHIRDGNICLLLVDYAAAYAVCFLLSGAFIRLNQKIYWLSYHVRWLDLISEEYWEEHRRLLNVLRLLLGMAALWLIAGGLSAYVQQEGGLIEKSVYLFIFVYGALLAAAAAFLPVFRRGFQLFLPFRLFSYLFGVMGALLLGAFLLIHIFALFVPKATGSETYVIVLGAPVMEDRASENLLARVDTAAKWLEANPDTIAILTGGKGDVRTEAQVMHDLLIDDGIPDGQLILENNASTTEENFRYSREKIPETEQMPIAVITNEFHLFRVQHHARHAGITDLRFIPVRTPADVRFGWFVRETITIIGYLFTGKLF